jgi:hypothetical protein
LQQSFHGAPLMAAIRERARAGAFHEKRNCGSRLRAFSRIAVTGSEGVGGMPGAAVIRAVSSLLILSFLTHARADGQELRTVPAQVPSASPGWGAQIDRDPSAPQPKLRASPAPRNAVSEQVRAEVALFVSAWLTESGPPLEQGLVWRIFTEAERTSPADPPRLRLLQTLREARPLLKLPPGDYAINVSYGRAQLTRQVSVAAGAAMEERFVLNAGGLIVRAVLASGEPPPDMSVTYDIYLAEGEQVGIRPKVVSGARPGLVVRLNAGQYHLVSVYGDANAIVRADVTVEPGKLTEATISHHSARVSFKLVARQGGEAQADTRWVIQTPQGETIVESTGALPSHVLAAGSYLVIARNGGRTFRREFVVEAGDPLQVEVVMQ